MIGLDKPLGTKIYIRENDMKGKERGVILAPH
jgi:hypothetical protein